MGIGRRSFLKFLPTAGVAVRSAAEAVARDLAKVEVSGLGNSSYGEPLSSGAFANDKNEKLLSQALQSEKMFGEIESLSFENNRFVSRIDPDIAVMRSFSLNAKICFQRQRNVALDMQEKSGAWKYPYRRMLELIGVK